MVATARSLRPIRNVKLPLVTIEPHLNPPLFLRRPSWWARAPGTLGLLFCDLIITGACIELTWNHWTERVPIGLSPDASSSQEPSKNQEFEWALRPTWQRFGLCAAHFMAGCFFAGGLLSMKTQFVRSLTILPPLAPLNAGPSIPKKVGIPDLRKAVIQNASHPPNTGFGFSLKDTWLEEGRDSTEVLLRNAEGNSRWFLGLQGALVNGQELPVEEARSVIIQQLKSRQTPTKF